jgi:hypothetical protein
MMMMRRWQTIMMRGERYKEEEEDEKEEREGER